MLTQVLSFLTVKAKGEHKHKTAHKQVCYGVTKGRSKILAPSSNRDPCNCASPLIECKGRNLKAVIISTSLTVKQLLNN
jgi:uncharacterized membrane protein